MRIDLPKSFLTGLHRERKRNVFVTPAGGVLRRGGARLFVWLPSQWGRRVEKVSKLKFESPEVRTSFLTRFYSDSAVIAPDRRGRIYVPARLTRTLKRGTKFSVMTVADGRVVICLRRKTPWRFPQ